MVIKSRICAVSGIFILSMLAVYCFGAAEPKTPKTPKTPQALKTPQTPQTPDPKISDAAAKIQQSLDAILSQVNEMKKPAAGDIANGQKMLEESKRYFPQMDDKQKAQYCLLQSWTAYYGGTIEAAFINAVKACKLDAASGDAWVSQAAMAVLIDKRPLFPRASRPVVHVLQHNQQNPGGVKSPETAQGAVQIQKGRLDFDVNFLFRNAIGKKIEPFQLHYQNGTTLDYKPGDKVLCMLFWRKVEAKKAPAANAAPKPAANTAPKPEAATAGEGMMNPTDIPGAFPEEASLAVFEDLFKAGTSGQIKFAAINLDPSDNQKTAEEEMITRSQAWSQVVATGQTEGQFSEFNTISPNKPVLMIADSAGTIRYAGPATGFIVPMLLAKIVPSPTTSTDAATKEVPTDGNSPAVTDGNSLPTNSNLPAAADSNSLPADGNSVSPAGQKPTPTPQAAKPQAQYKELSEEDKVQADKLINYADGLFMKAAGKRIITYKQGVELCRQVMKDYPGSEYADKARLLLRQVPENQRSKYGITDQELGL